MTSLKSFSLISPSKGTAKSMEQERLEPKSENDNFVSSFYCPRKNIGKVQKYLQIYNKYSFSHSCHDSSRRSDTAIALEMQHAKVQTPKINTPHC